MDSTEVIRAINNVLEKVNDVGERVARLEATMGERVARLETKLDHISDAKDVAYNALKKADEAHQVAEQAQKEVDELNNTWTWAERLVLGAVILAVLGVVIVKGGA